jgi:hypothetical protein
MPYAYKATDVVDILILGAGWTSQFLVPLLELAGQTYALATPQGTINKFCAGKYDDSKIVAFYLKPDDPDESEYATLPTASTVIVTFPIKEEGAAKKLVEKYNRIHAGSIHPQWILLGSSSVWEGKGKHDRSSPIKSTPRSVAEEEMLDLGGVVLNLAGLWGDERQPKNWPKRAINSKQQLKDKGSLHLIHGDDVARACLAVHKKFNAGERYLLTDQQCYDWWYLIQKWERDLEAESLADGGERPYKKWLAEVMFEEKVTSLPRSREQLGRVLDSDEFWTTMGIEPEFTLS